MVEYTRCIYHLPAKVLVIKMSDKEGFSGEGVWLDIDIRAGDFVDEGGFADVGVSTDEECAGIGIYGGKTGYVLPDLFEIG